MPAAVMAAARASNRRGALRGHGVDETGSVALAGLGAEGEVRDEEHAAADLRDGEVHLAVGVGEDPEADEPVGGPAEVGLGIVAVDAREDQQAARDGAGLSACDDDRRVRDPLDDALHAGAS